MSERHPYDPRKDLVTDSKHWEYILHNAWESDMELYGTLHGLRCGGAGVTTTATSYKLMQGEWDQVEWDSDIRNRLKPHTEMMISIFKLSRLGKLTDPKQAKGVFENGNG